ncbi:MAG: thiamine phosphate synthase [Pseudomonadota bacterium]
MTTPDQPQVYLLTPPEFELSVFSGQLARVLDDRDIACLRLTMATSDEDRIARAADTLRELAHARDVAVVIDSHVGLVERLGLDGVHLRDQGRGVRAQREALGTDAIVGAFCGTSQHVGMTAGEAGADYVAFGPVGMSSLGDGKVVEHDLFAWWSEAVEVPVVAEGHLDVELVAQLAPITDFFAIGEEIWRQDDPTRALANLLAPLS